MKEKDKMAMALVTPAMVLLVGSMMDGGSVVDEVMKGIIMGMGVVLCCTSLWTYGKKIRLDKIN